MLNIAICDDEPRELEKLSSVLNEFTERKKILSNIVLFSHPDELETVLEYRPFHIYLLDMVMPMLNGLDLGRTIRRISTDAQIIFITSEPGFALDAYAVNPLHYLLKPVNRQELLSVLELALKKINYENEVQLTLKTRSGIRTIMAGQVAFCEYGQHKALYMLTTGETVETLSLQTSFAVHLEPLLADRRFISPHTSFAVNMNQVERLTREGFFLRSGKFIPISGRQYSEVRSSYLDYRLSGEADR